MGSLPAAEGRKQVLLSTPLCFTGVCTPALLSWCAPSTNAISMCGSHPALLPRHPAVPSCCAAHVAAVDVLCPPLSALAILNPNLAALQRPHSWLPKSWTEPGSGGATLVRAAGFAAAARGGGGSFGGGSDSLFCTNVSGLKGNSPILIGLMEYFSVRSAGVYGMSNIPGTHPSISAELSRRPCPSLRSSCHHAAPPAPRGFLSAHRRRPPAALCQVRQAAQAHSHVRPAPWLGTH